MIQLGIKREPHWLDLEGLKLRLFVRPIAEPVMAHAQALAEKAVQTLYEQFRAVKESGGAIVGLPDLDDAEARSGKVEAEFTKALGIAAIIDWEGVFAEDGESKAPVTPAAVGELMEIYPIGTLFRERYLKSYDAVVAEKNGSGPARTGTGAAAPNTANSAAPTAAPAPAANVAPTASAAPTSSTPS